MTNSLERELGRLEAQMANMETDIQLLQRDVREIRDALVGYKGGWRVLTLIVAASASLGAMISKMPISDLFR
jgi:chromosome condensin MukBEF ATPase and DNA-binding subunit MukB